MSLSWLCCSWPGPHFNWRGLWREVCYQNGDGYAQPESRQPSCRHATDEWSSAGFLIASLTDAWSSMGNSIRAAWFFQWSLLLGVAEQSHLKASVCAYGWAKLSLNADVWPCFSCYCGGRERCNVCQSWTNGSSAKGPRRTSDDGRYY